MQYTNSPLATTSVDFGNTHSNPRQGKYNPTGAITVITPHHMAAVMTGKQCADMHRRSSGASANYYIGNDGDICLGIPESRRAWTSSSRDNDYNAITIEVSNSKRGYPWTISDKAFASLVALCADICKRNGIKQLNFTGDKTGNLTMHRYFISTACPGDYLAKKFPELAEKTNALLGQKAEMVTNKYTIDAFRADVRTYLKTSTNAAAVKKSPELSLAKRYYGSCKALTVFLQRYLQAEGYYTEYKGKILKVDGDFGPGTEDAVKKYQEQIVKSGIVDGVISAGGYTWKKLMIG